MPPRIHHVADDGCLDVAAVAFRQGTGSILAADARADDPKGSRVESAPQAVGINGHLEPLHSQLQIVPDAGKKPGLPREHETLGARGVEACRLHRRPGAARRALMPRRRSARAGASPRTRRARSRTVRSRPPEHGLRQAGARDAQAAIRRDRRALPVSADSRGRRTLTETATPSKAAVWPAPQNKPRSRPLRALRSSATSVEMAAR